MIHNDRSVYFLLLQIIGRKVGKGGGKVNATLVRHKLKSVGTTELKNKVILSRSIHPKTVKMPA